MHCYFLDGWEGRNTNIDKIDGISWKIIEIYCEHFQTCKKILAAFDFAHLQKCRTGGSKVWGNSLYNILRQIVQGQFYYIVFNLHFLVYLKLLTGPTPNNMKTFL